MDMPVVKFAATAAAGSYVLVTRLPQYLLFSNPSYTGTFTQLFLLQVVSWLFYKVILWPHYLSPLIGLPEPSGGSFWNGHWKKISSELTGAPALEWMTSIENDGLIRYKGILNSERLIVTSPKALSEVLTTKSYDFVKPLHVRSTLSRLLGVGVLLAEGDEHKTQRKALMPAFAFRHVKDLYPIFWDKTREVVNVMQKQFLEESSKAAVSKETTSDEKEKPMPPNTVITEVGGWASRATLDIIGAAGLGKEFNAIQDPETELNRTYRSIFSPDRTARMLSVLTMFLPLWVVRLIPVKRNGDIEKAVKVVRGVCQEMIDSKKEAIAQGESKDVDILSVAMASGGFTDENLINQLMTFLAAGHETTATSIIWAIYALCVHPEMQTRLRAEVRASLPSMDDADATISHSDLDSLPYLNAVCSEVLRYHAPVPMTMREAGCDTEIDGHFVPRGTKVMLVPYAVNKDPVYWGPDGREFNPDRWLTDGVANGNGGAKSNYNLLTFLHGPRSCIGLTFAKAEFAALLAGLVGRFEFELRDKEMLDEAKLILKGGVTNKPANGLWVRATVLEGW